MWKEVFGGVGRMGPYKLIYGAIIQRWWCDFTMSHYDVIFLAFNLLIHFGSTIHILVT